MARNLSLPFSVAARPKSVSLKPLTCWNCGFECHQGHECCMLSYRGLWDGPIPYPEESFLVCVCVYVCMSFSLIRCNINPLHYSELVEDRQTVENGRKMYRRSINDLSQSRLHASCT